MRKPSPFQIAAVAHLHAAARQLLFAATLLLLRPHLLPSLSSGGTFSPPRLVANQKMTRTKSSNIDQKSCFKTATQNQGSRLCVKNLPRYVSEDRMRAFFSQKGEITDVKLIRKNGKSREFGFVGYRTEREAQEAIKYFNNNFMDTRKIICESARRVGDQETPRPWSLDSRKKHGNMFVESKDHRSGGVNAKILNCKKDDECYNDPKFQEFLQVMQPRSKSKLWENDAPATSFLEIGTEVSNEKLNILECKRTVMKDMLKEDFSEQNAADGSTKEHCTKTFDSLASPHMKDEIGKILKTGRVFVSNLPFVASEDEVEEHFRSCGDISEVHLLVDKDTKRSKGRAFVSYLLPESAVRAYELLNESIFQGRPLKIKPAEAKNSLVASDFTQDSSKTFKQLRNEKRKVSELRGDTRGWNPLFMNADTVNENIARKFGVSKSELLDSEASDLPVRVALGESEILAETKKTLARMGVNVSMLEATSGKTNDSKRSRVLLVKNLPYCSSESELADMFGKFGNLDKVILPSTRTLALVIFLELTDAVKCFEKLRYKRYKEKPLYLQFLPEDILTQVPQSEGDSDNSVVSLEQQVEATTELDVDPDRIESRTLKVSNLHFKTSDEELRRHFTHGMSEGRVISARIVKHIKNGKNLSMGYGFIEFDSVNTATRAFKNLQRSNLDGHALKLEECQAKNDESQRREPDSNCSSTKLLVKNVAFEATKNEIRDLFSPFGQVKAVRLPKQFGKPLGFAFVEYATKQEATNAMTHLFESHFYGRHMCIEWAKKDKSVEELRAEEAKLSKKRKRTNVLNKVLSPLQSEQGMII